MSLIGNPLVRSSFPVNYFTGDGTTTTFVLSESAASVNSTEVFVNGAHIGPNNYTVDGTNLNFLVAPANNSVIVVRQLGLPGTVGVPAAGTVLPSMLSSGHPTWDVSGNVTVNGNLTVSGGSIAGNADSASRLSPGATINGTLFDGTSNIFVSVNENQVNDGTILARVGSAETITSQWTFNQPIVGATPTLGSHLTTKNYVDTMSTGLAWKQPVRAATTANITLSGTQTVDGIALVAGNRVLVKNQSAPAQNGIYLVAAGAWTRATDFDAEAETAGAAVLVQLGTINADTGWVQTAEVTTIGTDTVTFVQFQGPGLYVAGGGLTLTGNSFDIGTASSSRIVINPDTIDLATIGTPVTASFVKLTTDAYGRVSATTPVVASDITSLSDAQYVLKAGDTMTGALSVPSGITSFFNNGSAADANAARNVGFQIFTNTAGSTNFPSAAGITLESRRAASSSTSSVGSFQLYSTNVSAAPDFYLRKIATSVSGTETWTSWGRIWTDQDFTSTTYVKTVGDTMTGPLIMKGANATTGGIVQSNSSDNSVINRLFVDSGLGGIGTSTNHSLVFQTNGTQNMRLDTSGQLGIGPGVNPTVTLDVQAPAVRVVATSTTGTNAAYFRTVNTAGGFYLGVDSTIGSISGVANAAMLYSNGATPIILGNNATVRALISATTGSMTLGFNSAYTPVARLGINTPATTGNALGLILNNPTSYGVGTGTNGTSIRFTHSTADAGSTGVLADITGVSESETTSTVGALTFGTRTGATEATTEHMRISSQGNVTITVNDQAGTHFQITGGATTTTGIDSQVVRSGVVGTGVPGTGSNFALKNTTTLTGVMLQEFGGSLLTFTTTDNSTWLERMRITAGGTITHGGTPQTAMYATVQQTPALQILGTGSYGNMLLNYNAASTGAAGLYFSKSRSNTVGGQTLAVSGDSSGYITFNSSDGTQMIEGARIEARVSTAVTPTTNIVPNLMNFMVQPYNGGAPATVLTINGSSNASTPPSVTVAGSTYISSSFSQTLGLLSGSTTGTATLGMGRTSISASIALIGVVNAGFNSTGIDDLVIRNSTASTRMWFGTGTGATHGMILNAPPTSVNVASSLLQVGSTAYNANLGYAIDAAGTIRSQGGEASASGYSFRALNAAATAGISISVSPTSGGGGFISSDAGPMGFLAGGSQAMYIDASRNVIIGLGTSPAVTNAGIVLGGPSANSVITQQQAGTGALTAIAWYRNGSGTASGSISTTSTTTTYNTASDERLKKNIEDADSAGDLIDAIKVRQFDWKSTEEHVDHGFVAQELAEVVPSAVIQGETWGVDNSKLVALLLKEIQELRARVAALEAK